MTAPQPDATTRIHRALAAPDPSIRQRAAMLAGTYPARKHVDPLITRCAVEPDFFVRDMLTWALTRQPEHLTVPRLLAQLEAPQPQARSQALHTLSKIGAARTWPAVRGLLNDHDDEVARSAWRAAAVVAPAHARDETIETLATQLGRGDTDMQLSLSRALIALADSAESTLDEVLRTAASHPAMSDHAAATQLLWADPDAGFAIDHARKVRALAGSPHADR
ncbi:HEAT repeat domain-containing protein [Ruania rhizosphaerae]|uniref:HEAT repeat domain-containing protein n=1 Tax=Ruania rhizosphaerae TaxID=1840413 RepID=UPI00135A3989|nr:HEAT repeat domain-containing protein [Ruania rhizosphaerae]